MTKDLNGTRLLIISNSTEECSAIVHDGNLVVSDTLHVGGELFHFGFFFLFGLVTFGSRSVSCKLSN